MHLGQSLGLLPQSHLHLQTPEPRWGCRCQQAMMASAPWVVQARDAAFLGACGGWEWLPSILCLAIVYEGKGHPPFLEMDKPRFRSYLLCDLEANDRVALCLISSINWGW